MTPEERELLLYTIISVQPLFVLLIQIFAIDESEFLGTAEGKES